MPGFALQLGPVHRSYAAGLALVLAILIGCKTPPKPVVSVPPPRVVVPPRGDVLPVAHQSPELLQPSQRDALPPPGQRLLADVVLLGIDEAVATALAGNPRLRQMAAESRVAWANTDVAYAPFLPEIGTTFRYSAFTEPVVPGGSFVPASLPAGVTSFVIAEAGVQYTIADFGRRAGHFGIAMHRSRRQDLAWGRAQQTIAFETVQAYFQLLAAHATVKVREEAVRDAERILDDTKVRREAGVVEREAVLRAEVELSLARQNLLIAQQGVFDATALLNVVMGRSPTTPLEVADVLARPEVERTLAECLEEAIVARREIGMAREAVAEAQHGVQAARGEKLPKVFVRGTTLRADSDGPLNGPLSGAGIHVEQPLYAGGRLNGQLRASEAQVAVAIAGLQAITDNISLQVCVAYQALQTDRQRIDLAETSVRQAHENLRLTRVRYQNGNATPTDIVDAQTALVQTQTSYYTAVFGYLTGLARLEYALGADQQRLLEQLREEANQLGPEAIERGEQRGENEPRAIESKRAAAPPGGR